MLFDECIFQQECVVFRFDDGEFDMTRVPDKRFGFGQLVFLVAEIGTQPVSQIFGFANIKNYPVRVHELVNTRIGGYRRRE
jgi:hypothetical protein